jgi:nucleoid-associated protein YgaU
MTIRKFISLIIVVVGTFMLSSCNGFLCPRLDKTRHITREGDTLGKIAVAYYGSTKQVDLILEANPKLELNSQLVPGQLIRIPYTN